jgi:hypothetical protein
MATGGDGGGGERKKRKERKVRRLCCVVDVRGESPCCPKLSDQHILFALQASKNSIIDVLERPPLERSGGLNFLERSLMHSR